MTTTTTAADPAAGPHRRSDAAPLLEVRGLCVDYLGEPPVRACHQVDFTLHRGEIFGIAGESGSGKSTLVTALARLQRPPAETTEGQLLLHRDGAVTDLLTLDERQLRKLRWNEISVVLQSAMDALNLVMRLHAQFADVLPEHRPGIGRGALDTRAENCSAWSVSPPSEPAPTRTNSPAACANAPPSRSPSPASPLW